MANQLGEDITGLDANILPGDKNSTGLDLGQYEQMVRERTRELEKANQQLQKEISKHRDIENRLLASEARYREVVDSLQEVIFEIDPRGNLIFFNQRAFEFFGCARDYPVQSINVLDFIIPGDREKVLHNLSRVMQGERVGPSEYTALKMDGTTFPIIIHSSPIIRAGRAVGLRGVIIDITDQKLMENMLQSAESAFEQSLRNLSQTLDGAVNALGMMAEKRDPYTAGHQHRVAGLACRIAGEMGLSPDQVESIRVAGLLHDIGKIYVPTDILNKPCRLIDIEMALIKTHPRVGFEIVKAIPFNRPVGEIILQHHERMDGSGYPRGLPGDEILLESRILAVADTVEAMSSHRPYRPALGLEKALREIKKYSGVHFDPVVVKSCLATVARAGFKMGSLIPLPQAGLAD